jgi:hypothetical protein
MERQIGSSDVGLSREAILSALNALSEELKKEDITGEVCIFGGTVMVLAFTARISTKDVDAVFVPSQSIRRAAARVAADQNLQANWLNDGVKGFLSHAMKSSREISRSFLIYG